MQTKTGAVPTHLCGEEVSEWLRLRVVPAIQKAVAEHFQPNKNEWFDEAKYQELRQAMQWPENKPLFLLSADMDPRHSCTDMWEIRRRKAEGVRPGKQRDRRDLTRGTYGWMDISRMQYIPSAPKVPDTIQQPVESFFGTLKTLVRKEYQGKDGNGWRPMVAAVDKIFQEWAPTDSFAKRWEHACNAIAVFAGEKDDWVQIRRRWIKCTHGGWVPKLVAA